MKITKSMTAFHILNEANEETATRFVFSYIFHPAPDKVEVKHQNIQTKILEIKDQQVQTDSIAQNQGTYMYKYMFDVYITHSLAFMDTCDFLCEVQSFCLQHTYEELK